MYRYCMHQYFIYQYYINNNLYISSLTAMDSLIATVEGKKDQGLLLVKM